MGMIGAGRMGADMSRRMAAAGVEVVIHDVDPDALEPLAAEGFATNPSLTSMATMLTPPRIVWIMIPSTHVDETISALCSVLTEGDIVVDGGNSHFDDARRRADELSSIGAHFVDVGTSGGVHGRERGYCLMIGGEEGPVSTLGPVFDALAPGTGAAERTPGRSGPPTTAEMGWMHCGPTGAGHFTKMVHNGIEYGLMAAYAEGLDLLRHGFAGDADRGDPGPIDVADVAELWRRGSVIGSWLLDLTARALLADAELGEFESHVADSGEGRWSVQAAVDAGVPTPVLATALFSRFSSRGNGDYASRVLSAMRHEFGGHAEFLRASSEPKGASSP